MKLSDIVKDMKPSATAFCHILRSNGIRQANHLLGRSCMSCGEGSQLAVCQGCCEKLQKPKVSCKICGVALAAETQHSVCRQCIIEPPDFERLDYLANYDGKLADWIVAAKIGRQASALEAVQVLISWHFNQIEFEYNQDYTLLPVPIPKYRLMQRGFNLPLIMARQISKQQGMQVLPSRVVLLPRYTKKQARLSKKKREKRHDKLIINGQLPKKVLIIDDVVTTAGTVNNLAKVLCENGVENVAVWSLSRAQLS